MINLGRAGFFFAATSEEASAMNLMLGPKAEIELGENRTTAAPVPKEEIPRGSEPWFLDLVVAAVLNTSEATRLEVFRRDGEVTLYRLPPAATNVLAELVPGRGALTMSIIETICDRLMARAEVTQKYKRGGVVAAVMTLRGYALEASPRGEGKEVYYWFWQKPPHSTCSEPGQDACQE